MLEEKLVGKMTLEEVLGKPATTGLKIGLGLGLGYVLGSEKYYLAESIVLVGVSGLGGTILGQFIDLYSQTDKN